MTMPMPMASARGMVRAGSRISPATMFICCHPPIVNSTATNAVARPAASDSRGGGAFGTSGGASSVVHNTRPPRINAASATIFATVKTFWTIAPGLIPK